MGSSAGPFAGTSFPFSSAQPYGAEGFADAAPLAFAAPELEDALFGSALAEDAPSAFAAACISSRFFWRPASEDEPACPFDSGVFDRVALAFLLLCSIALGAGAGLLFVYASDLPEIRALET